MAAIDHIVLDNPTNNFLTWNPLDKARDNTVLSNGNLTSTDTSSGYSTHYGNIVVPSSGLYYVEFTIKTFGSSNAVGIYVGNNRTWPNIYTSTGYPYDANTFMLMHNGLIYYNGTAGDNSYHPTFAAGDVIALVIDGGSRNVWLRKNGSLTSGDNYTTGSQSGGVVGALTAINALPDGDMYVFTMASGAAASGYSTSAIVMNAGQDRTFGGYPNSLATSTGYSDANGHGDFYYQPPTGALALCTQNIPTPSTDSAAGNGPEDFFKTVIWTGSNNNVNVDFVNFTPDFLWVKNRYDSASSTISHSLIDTVRGDTKQLASDSTGVETTITNLSTFNSNNTVTLLGGYSRVNDGGNSRTYVGWGWKAGGPPASDGVAMVDGTATTTAALKTTASATITPTRMSVNTKAGFSIVKYTSPNNSSDQTVPHGLSSAPNWIIVKNLDNTYNWDIYHSSVSNSGIFTGAAINSRTAFGTVNNSIFTTKNTFTHNSTHNYIAYCWHSVAGYSAFGSYTGNSSTDGPFVYTGFKPAWVMVKRTTNVGGGTSWFIWDNVRSPHNEMVNALLANDPSNQLTDREMDFLSNAFKPKASDGNYNASDETYIYMAFAEQPINYANAR